MTFVGNLLYYTSIRDLTVAVIGTGRIGSIVAEILEKVYNSKVVVL